MSRVVGWITHWNEQLKRNQLYQPSQIYSGTRGQSYLPLANRS
jgi:citrate synthase